MTKDILLCSRSFLHFSFSNMTNNYIHIQMDIVSLVLEEQLYCCVHINYPAREVWSVWRGDGWGCIRSYTFGTAGQAQGKEAWRRLSESEETTFLHGNLLRRVRYLSAMFPSTYVLKETDPYVCFGACTDAKMKLSAKLQLFSGVCNIQCSKMSFWAMFFLPPVY